MKDLYAELYPVSLKRVERLLCSGPQGLRAALRVTLTVTPYSIDLIIVTLIVQTL